MQCWRRCKRQWRLRRRRLRGQIRRSLGYEMCEHFAQWSALGIERHQLHQWSRMVWLCKGMRETSGLHCLPIHAQLCQRYCSQKHVGRDDRFWNMCILHRSRCICCWGPSNFVRCCSSDQSKYSTACKFPSVCFLNTSDMPHTVPCFQRYAVRRCFRSVLADLLRRQHGFF